MIPFVLPAALCLAAILAETLAAGRDHAAVIGSLQQPKWALPMHAWYLIGVAYYGICFVTLYRIMQGGIFRGLRFFALGLVVAVMGANAVWNWVFFRRRNLGLSFRLFIPYSALVVLLLGALILVDLVSAVLFGVYLLYFPYAMAWAYHVWKLNR
jgi:tryptophan-rich sensory protein